MVEDKTVKQNRNHLTVLLDKVQILDKIVEVEIALLRRKAIKEGN